MALVFDLNYLQPRSEQASHTQRITVALEMGICTRIFTFLKRNGDKSHVSLQGTGIHPEASRVDPTAMTLLP